MLSDEEQTQIRLGYAKSVHIEDIKKAHQLKEREEYQAAARVYKGIVDSPLFSLLSDEEQTQTRLGYAKSVHIKDIKEAHAFKEREAYMEAARVYNGIMRSPLFSWLSDEEQAQIHLGYEESARLERIKAAQKREREEAAYQERLRGLEAIRIAEIEERRRVAEEARILEERKQNAKNRCEEGHKAFSNQDYQKAIEIWESIIGSEDFERLDDYDKAMMFGYLAEGLYSINYTNKDREALGKAKMYAEEAVKIEQECGQRGEQWALPRYWEKTSPKERIQSLLDGLDKKEAASGSSESM